jgi:hypothetical protein
MSTVSSEDHVPRDDRPSRGVILRDLLIFQVKLWFDGLKDVVLSPLSIVAVVVDVLFRRPGRKSLFYRVMSLGERFDLWLNLYGPAQRAEEGREGLLNRPTIEDHAHQNQVRRLREVRNALQQDRLEEPPPGDAGPRQKNR